MQVRRFRDSPGAAININTHLHVLSTLQCRTQAATYGAPQNPLLHYRHHTHRLTSPSAPHTQAHFTIGTTHTHRLTSPSAPHTQAHFTIGTTHTGSLHHRHHTHRLTSPSAPHTQAHFTIGTTHTGSSASNESSWLSRLHHPLAVSVSSIS